MSQAQYVLSQKKSEKIFPGGLGSTVAGFDEETQRLQKACIEERDALYKSMSYIFPFSFYVSDKLEFENNLVQKLIIEHACITYPYEFVRGCYRKFLQFEFDPRFRASKCVSPNNHGNAECFLCDNFYYRFENGFSMPVVAYFVENSSDLLAGQVCIMSTTSDYFRMYTDIMKVVYENSQHFHALFKRKVISYSKLVQFLENYKLDLYHWIYSEELTMELTDQKRRAFTQLFLTYISDKCRDFTNFQYESKFVVNECSLFPITLSLDSFAKHLRPARWNDLKIGFTELECWAPSEWIKLKTQHLKINFN